jgi:hypothetical protein
MSPFCLEHYAFVEFDPGELFVRSTLVLVFVPFAFAISLALLVFAVPGDLQRRAEL